VYNGTQPIVGCPQKATPWSEDCLYMSIYVPKSFRSGPKRDVLVYMHGGAFVAGNRANFVGRDMANLTNTVVISVNYRLGILGLLGHEAFLWESGTYGNYHMLDQRQAFIWVRDNIRAFGGNPRSVTISGHSSGSISVAHHAVSPLSWGLYHKAVGLSGVGYSGTLLNDRSWITDLMWTVLEKVNCSTTLCNRNSPVIVGLVCAAQLRQCFRAVPVATVMQVQATIPELVKPRPAIDGLVIPAQPLDMVKAGLFYRVPTLHAVGNNESTVLINRDYPFASVEADFDAYVTKLFGAALIPFAKELYPVGVAGGFPTYFSAMAKIDTDWFYTCPTQRWLKALSASGSPNLYMYFDDYVGPWYDPVYGTFHGQDSIYAAGQGCLAAVTPKTCAPLLLATTEAPLVHQLQAIWTSMAKTGTPGMAHWPRYSADNNWPYLHISGVNNSFIDTATRQAAQCALWDSLAV
jgi:para-nitrobenzyl esterase